MHFPAVCHTFLPHDFLRQVERPAGKDACWRWFGSLHPVWGYAVGPRGRPAVYWSWELHFGPVPIGHKVIRTCHYRPCVAPHHLRLIPRK